MVKSLIYDVGMNNGDDTAYYLAKGYHVIAIEANPLLVEKASVRFKREIELGDLIILNIGVSNHDGAFPFWVCDSNHEWSSFNVSAIEEKGVPFREINVLCRTPRSIFEEFGVPYYLKLDIEGSEIYCLRDLKATDLPIYISFEKTSFWTTESLSLLHHLGFTGFKLISQRNYLAVEFPPTEEQKHCLRLQNLLASRNVLIRIARKIGARRWLQRQIDRGRYHPDWTFAHGSSGPLGESTSGKWQSFEQICETLRKANCSFEAREQSVFWDSRVYGFWADFHVKRTI